MTGQRHRGVRSSLVTAAIVAGSALAAPALADTQGPGSPAAAGSSRPAGDEAAATPLANSTSAASSPVFTLPVRVTLTRLDPKAPQPGQRVAIVGRLANTSTSLVTDLAVQLRINGVAVSSRGQMMAFQAGGDGEFPSRSVPGAVGKVGTSSLAAGATTSFRLDVSTDALGLAPDEWRVYELGVDALGGSPQGRGVVGRMRTFLPWAPRTTRRAALRLAWLWPLVDRPHRAGTGPWLDDRLASELGASGTLTGLVAAGARASAPPAPLPPGAHPAPTAKPVPVAWVVDPLIVEDATLMAAGYTVREGGSTRPGAGRADATRWLDSLRRAVRGKDVFGLPYADPDVTAAVRHGLSSDVRAASAVDAGLPGATHLAWPPDGRSDSRTLATVTSTGNPAVVLSDTNLPVATNHNFTPSAETTVPLGTRTVDALLTDSRLTDVVDAGADDPSRAGLAEQAFLAETLMIVTELPFTPRDVVVAPDRRWRPAPAYAAALLSDTGRVPWIQPVALHDMLAAPRSTVARGPLFYPSSAKDAELPGPYLAGVQGTRADLMSLATALPRGTGVLTGLDRAVLRTESSAWRTRLDAAVDYRDAVDAAVATTAGKLRIASAAGSLVTLTSRSGRVPVTIANDLDAPALVRLHLDAGQRLTIAGGGEIPITVPAGTQYTIEVRARARTAGVFPLTVALLAPDGTALGPPVTLSVRSTVYGTLALAITGAATAVLFVAVVVRLVRRAIRSRREVTE